MTKTEGGYVTQQYLKDLFTICIYVCENEFLGICVQIELQAFVSHLEVDAENWIWVLCKSSKDS